MRYSHSTIEELKNGLFKATIYTEGIIYGTYTKHESFKTINECKEWLLEERCPSLEIKYIANLPEGIVKKDTETQTDIQIKIPKAPKLPKLYKDIVKK
jgi:hypothetical protein